jgi:hypothetical protein
MLYSCYYEMKLLENIQGFDVAEQHKCTLYFYKAILFGYTTNN